MGSKNSAEHYTLEKGDFQTFDRPTSQPNRRAVDGPWGNCTKKAKASHRTPWKRTPGIMWAIKVGSVTPTAAERSSLADSHPTKYRQDRKGGLSYLRSTDSESSKNATQPRQGCSPVQREGPISVFLINNQQQKKTDFISTGCIPRKHH